MLHPPQRLSAEELDQLLHDGWRSTGQAMYYSDFLRSDEDDALHGVVQTRVSLKDFRFGRKQRRLLRKNGELFRVEIGPIDSLTYDYYRVNDLYAEVHPEKTREDLDFHTTTNYAGQVIPTYAVSVYLKDELIAFSFFNPGNRNVYSKAGIYDPKYVDFSLGNYTLLLEVQWAIDNGLEYYHPGYYSPTWPVFHYKLRLGKMDFKDCRDGKWKPLPNNDPDYPPNPYGVVEKALGEALPALQAAGLPFFLKEYPSFTARYFYPGHGGGLLDTPLLLQAERPLVNGVLPMIVYDFHTGEYIAFQPMRGDLRDTRVRLTGPTGIPRYPYPIRMGTVYYRTESVARLTDFLAAHVAVEGRG